MTTVKLTAYSGLVVGDDWSDALDAALADARRPFHFGPGLTGTPGTHARVEIPAASGPYRLSRTVQMRSGDHFVGDSPESSVLLFTNGGDGFVLDSHWNQSSEDFGIESLGVHQLLDADKSKGVWLKGGGHGVFRDVSIGGYDVGMRLDRSELITIDRLKVASWPTIGRLIPTAGVVFGLVEGMGGGVTNGNRVRDSQFNGPRYGIVSEDGAGNVVEGSNFNACGAMLLCTGAQGLVFRSCLAEGQSEAAAILCGIDGGYPGSGRVCWQALSVEDCVISIGTARADGQGTSALLRTSIGAHGEYTSFRGTRVLGVRPDGLGGDLGAMIADQASYVFLTGPWTPPASYSSGDLRTIYAAVSPPRKAFWNKQPYGFAP